MTGIETIKVRAVADEAAKGIDLTNATGVTGVVFDNNSNNAVVQNAQALPTITINGGTAGKADVVSVKDSLAVTGAAVNVTLNGATAGNVNVAGNVAGTFDTLAITATGTASKIGAFGSKVAVDGTTADTFKTITVTGSGDVTVTTAFAVAKTIDASAATGKVSLSVAGDTNDGSSAAKAKTITLGAGDDTINVGSAVGTFDTINGGAGSNTIGITDGAKLVTGMTLKNFQTLDISGGTGSYDVSLFGTNSTITGLKIAADLAASSTVSKAAANTTLTMTTALTKTLTLNELNDTGAGANSDTLAVKLAGAGIDNSANTKVLDLGGIDLLNIVSTKSATTAGSVINKMGEFNAPAVTTVTITGDQEFQWSNVGKTAGSSDVGLQKVDASALTGKFTFAADGSSTSPSAALLIKGSATAANTINMKALANNSTVTLGTAADSITLDTGKVDIVKFQAATDSTLSTIDSITNFTTTKSVIDLSVFAIAAAKQGITTSTAVAADGFTPTIAALTGFFGTKALVAVKAGADSYLYVDANSNGNFDSGADLVIKLIGIDATGAGFAVGTDVKWA